MDRWMIACAAGVLLARVGLTLYSCGLVRAKNSSGTLLRHVADVCLAALAFWAVGIAVLDPAGRAKVIDVATMFGVRGDEAGVLSGHAFLMLTASLFASGIVVGALTERSRFWPSLAPAVLLGGILTPLLARWVGGHGWLFTRLGFHDAAGASFIHLAAGTSACVASIIVGARSGKYHRDGSSSMIPGHSMPLAGAGATLLLAAWVPYVLAFSGGAVAGVVAINVVLSGAAGGLVSLIVGQWRYGKPDISLTLAGVIGGLVAITAGADVMNNAAAVGTGAVAGVIVPWFVLQIDMVWRIDDPTGATAIHGVGAAWGLIATGLFGSTGGNRLRLIGAELVGAVVVVGVVGVVTAGAFLVMRKVLGVRAREEDEFDGLDLAEHDIGSYPDFQQNTIKSYHLREA